MEPNHLRLSRLFAALLFVLAAACGKPPYSDSPTPSADDVKNETDPAVRAALLDTDDPEDAPEGDIVGSGFW